MSVPHALALAISAVLPVRMLAAGSDCSDGVMANESSMTRNALGSSGLGWDGNPGAFEDVAANGECCRRSPPSSGVGHRDCGHDPKFTDPPGFYDSLHKVAGKWDIAQVNQCTYKCMPCAYEDESVHRWCNGGCEDCKVPCCTSHLWNYDLVETELRGQRICKLVKLQKQVPRPYSACDPNQPVEMEVSAENYWVGCYVAPWYEAWNLIVPFGSTGLTCAEAARTKGYEYFWLLNGGHIKDNVTALDVPVTGGRCYSGNSFGEGARVSDSECGVQDAQGYKLGTYSVKAVYRVPRTDCCPLGASNGALPPTYPVVSHWFGVGVCTARCQTCTQLNEDVHRFCGSGCLGCKVPCCKALKEQKVGSQTLCVPQG